MYLTFCDTIGAIIRDHTGKDDPMLTDGGDHADLASTIAFSLAKDLKKAPPLIAAEIVNSIAERVMQETGANTFAIGPYVNFVFGEKYCSDVLIQATCDGYGSGKEKPERVVLEHTSANPNGPLHVGHIRNTIIGDTLTRCFRKAGYPLEVQYYVNDMGRQIAIVAWGIASQRADIYAEGKGDHLIAEVYIEANRHLDVDPSLNAAIDRLMQLVESGDPDTISQFKIPVKRCLDGFKDTLEKMNVKHDRFVYESDFIRNGDTEKVLSRISHLPQACIDEILSLDLSQYGFEKSYILRRSDGTSVYAARDLAFHIWKGHNFDRVIDILGADHKLIGTQLQATLDLIGEKPPEIVFFEFVSLPEGSMSTRKGKFISADELIAETERRALEEVTVRRPELHEEQRVKIAHAVAISAIRYDIIRTIPEKNTIFDWKEALDFEKQSGPYIQYAHARACSILEKAGTYTPCFKAEGEGEIALVKKIALFPKVISEVVTELKPHLLAIYARELADLFNSFYHAEPVLRAEEHVRNRRLTLVNATRNTLKEALETLGIDALRAM
ncbi:MAG: arginine--tRNA ligase [Methanomicrobiales archaeon]|nr:arginine--tRNA ligase [Methanomicrobiales archaeon]